MGTEDDLSGNITTFGDILKNKLVHQNSSTEGLRSFTEILTTMGFAFYLNKDNNQQIFINPHHKIWYNTPDNTWDRADAERMLYAHLEANPNVDDTLLVHRYKKACSNARENTDIQYVTFEVPIFQATMSLDSKLGEINRLKKRIIELFISSSPNLDQIVETADIYSNLLNAQVKEIASGTFQRKMVSEPDDDTVRIHFDGDDSTAKIQNGDTEPLPANFDTE